MRKIITSYMFQSAALKKCNNILLSIAFVIAFNRYFFENHLLGNESIINFFLIIAAYLMLHFSSSLCDKHLKTQSTLFSVFLSTTLFVGRSLYYRGNLDTLFAPAYELLLNLISIAGFSAVFSVILTLLIHYVAKIESRLRNTPPDICLNVRCLVLP